MTEPTILCPQCKTEIRLTESLAAPLLEATRKEFADKVAQKEIEVTERERVARERERLAAEAQTRVREEVAERVAQELKSGREKIAIEEANKAKLASADELERKTRELVELQDVLRENNSKLADAQNEQAALKKKQRELDDARRELELTVERRVQAEVQHTRQQAMQEAEEGQKLRLMEKEQTIAAMQRQIEELLRRAEQGSQQMQGEVQELEIENLLKTRFSSDSIEPVAKGEFGGDVLHRVVGLGGTFCGSILWETKRTKNWSDGWLTKLRADQRAAKADVAVLVSQALPKGVDSFELIDGIWVTHARFALPVALVLRQTVLEIAAARQSSEGVQSKTELMYQYLTGPIFRQRVEAIVEAFSTMQADLDSERKVLTKQWAKRQAQIDRVMQSTVGMYGDLQGIAGRSLQEIEGLEILAIGVDSDPTPQE